MPFAGPRDGGASMWAAYASGAGLKMARRQSQMEQENHNQLIALREATAKIQQAQEKRAEQTHLQRSNMERAEFEEDRLDAQTKRADKAKATAQDTELDRAATMGGYAAFNDYGKAHPELIPDVESAYGTLGKITDPKARSMFALMEQQRIGGKAALLDKSKSKQAWSEAMRRNYLGGADGSPDERMQGLFETVNQGLDSDELTGKQAMEVLEKRRAELAADDADRMERTETAQAALQQWAQVVPPGPQRRALYNQIGQYQRGGADYKAMMDGIKSIVFPDTKAEIAQESLGLRKEEVGIKKESLDLRRQELEADGKIEPKAAPAIDEKPVKGASDSDKIAWRDAWKAAHKDAGREELAAALKAKFPDLQ